MKLLIYFTVTLLDKKSKRNKQPQTPVFFSAVALNVKRLSSRGCWGTHLQEQEGRGRLALRFITLTQLAAAKFVATALCKGSGLVGGLYAPSLMIGAAVGAVFGGSAAELVNSAIPGNVAVAQPQAYALVSFLFLNELIIYLFVGWGLVDVYLHYLTTVLTNS